MAVEIKKLKKFAKTRNLNNATNKALAEQCGFSLEDLGIPAVGNGVLVWGFVDNKNRQTILIQTKSGKMILLTDDHITSLELQTAAGQI